jgi:mxaJ protein
MKKRLLWALVAASCLILSSVTAQSWELRVCADPNNLPYTNEQGEGLDNKLVDLIAEQLDAQVTYEWFAQGINMVQRKLRDGDCDLILGVGESYQGMLSTLAYYQSTFIFAYRDGENYAVETLDDPVLRSLRLASETAGIPPYQSLVNRNLSEKTLVIDSRNLSQGVLISPILEAVADGQVDVAILWGPLAGYFNQKRVKPLKIVPLLPEFELPATSMIYAVTMIVRPGDDALRDRLNFVIANNWERIQQLLQSYGFPLIELPQPILEAE